MMVSDRSSSVRARPGSSAVTVSILLGIGTFLVTGAVALAFLQAATWSSIHGGMSGLTLAVLWPLALGVPPVCGFLVGRAIFRRWPERGTTRVHCPDCGCVMKPHPAAHQAAVMECPIHGPYPSGDGGDRA